MTDKRLKDRIKEVKKQIRDYKKEIETARKCEEWDYFTSLCNKLANYHAELNGLEKLYRKEE